MPRQRRHAPGGFIYHVINRGVGRRTIFHKQEDYVERNALRANLVERAEHWTWSSIWRRENRRGLTLLSPWPVECPTDWVDFVNEPQTPEELDALRRSVNRGCPFGDDSWRDQTAKQLGLESTMREPGRPRKSVLEEE